MYKKILVVIFGFCLVSCSSKTITYSPIGEKNVITVTDAARFSDAQKVALIAYYEACANPPVIAKITQPDGTVVDIHSQILPPAPNLKQHQNQVIEPVMGTLKTGIQIIGGGYMAKEIIGAMQGVSINNSGAGNVTYDRSEAVTVETTEVQDSTIKDSSDNPSTVTEDNHVENAEPEVVVVEKEEVVVVEKETVEVVNPEVIVVDPSYPPATTE